MFVAITWRPSTKNDQSNVYELNWSQWNVLSLVVVALKYVPFFYVYRNRLETILSISIFVDTHLDFIYNKVYKWLTIVVTDRRLLVITKMVLVVVVICLYMKRFFNSVSETMLNILLHIFWEVPMIVWVILTYSFILDRILLGFDNNPIGVFFFFVWTLKFSCAISYFMHVHLTYQRKNNISSFAIIYHIMKCYFKGKKQCLLHFRIP